MRLTLFPKLLIAFVLLSLVPLLWLSLDAARRVAEVGREAEQRSTEALDAKARQALELQAVALADQIARFLEERVQDLRIVGELPMNPDSLLLFCRSRTAEVTRRRRGADGAIEDYRIRIPIYSEAAWIGPDGQEVFRVDRDWMAPSRDLRDVSEPLNTTYGVEDYFQQALDMPPGVAWVGHLVGRHVAKEAQLGGAATPEQAVGGAEYEGHVRFALAVRDGGNLRGVVELALDHAHLMEFTQHVLPLSRERVPFPSYLSGNYAFMFDDQGWIITHPKFWDIRGLDEHGKWVQAYSKESTAEDVGSGRIPFNLDRAGFVHSNYPLVAAAVRRGVSGVTRTFNVAGVDKVMAYAPIAFRQGPYASTGVFGGVTIGALTEAFHREAAVTGAAIARASRQTLRTGVLLAWVLGILVLGAAFGMSRAIAKPVHTMAHMSARIAAGDLTARAEVAQGDELGGLAQALNRMARLLEEKEGRLGESHKALERSRDDARATAGRLEEQLSILNHIQSISEFLGTTFDREEVLRIILRTCVEGLGFDRVLLYMLEPDGDTLACAGANGFDGADEVRVRQRPLKLSRDDCAATRAVRSGRAEYIGRVESAAGLSSLDLQLARAAGTSSFVYVPMKIRDGVVGALGADNAVSGRPIPKHQVGPLQIVAGQAARAVERARLYEEATRSRAFIEAVVDCLASGLVTLDREGHVLTVNPYAEESLGIPTQVEPGRSLEEYGVDPTLAAWVSSLRVGVGGEPAEFEVKTPRGRRTFTWVPSRLGKEGEEGLILQFRDVTEERAMNRALERVDRLASLGRMAAGVAHEIRNPLTGVSLLLDDLHDRLPVGEDRSLAARALQELERLDGIVQELLAYARVDRVERSPCPIGEVLDQSLFLVKKQARSQGVSVSLHAGADLPRVHADPEKLKQALLNLYLNALQAMGGGGALQVEARRIPGGVEIRVEDTGPGIPQGEAERIFEPFYTLRPGGTGLGLSIAHTIFSDHGGSVEVASEPGRGAIFFVRLPEAAPPNATDASGEVPCRPVQA